MRLTDVKAALVLMDTPNDLNRATHGKMETNLVQVFTDDGVTGTYLAWEWSSTGTT